jgi:esterase
MQLFFKEYGNGKPLIILHGLFGSGDNWTTLGKKLADYGFSVFLMDMRNHGRSPWGDHHSYSLMASDIEEFISSHNLKQPILLGHSMGGKAAMQVAIDNSNLLSALIIIDIAPRYYEPHHQDIIKALTAVDFNIVKTRSGAEKIISQYIADAGTVQFLLKNLYWKDDNTLAWRFNLDVLAREIEFTGTEIIADDPVNVPALFIKGELSKYISADDDASIYKIFPKAEIEEIKNAGHWVHADQPDALLETVVRFINSTG